MRLMCMKALLGIMHPRRLDFFLRSLESIDYMDILLAKNYPIIEAQNRIRDFFLKHDYDILIFTSDDVMIPYLAPLRIKQDMEILGHDIITGYSIIRPRRREVNITRNMPYRLERRLDKPVFLHQYGFLKIDDVFRSLSQGEYLIRVFFVGWSLTGMTRQVVESWTPRGWYFQTTPPYHSIHEGRRGFWASSDLWFSYQAYKNGFEAYADLTVHVPHYPPNPRDRTKVLLVGKEKPQLEFIKAKKEI